MLEARERIAAYKIVLGTVHGQVVLEDLIAFAKVHSSITEGEPMIRGLGRADVVMRFIEMSNAEIPTPQQEQSDEQSS